MSSSVLNYDIFVLTKTSLALFTGFAIIKLRQNVAILTKLRQNFYGLPIQKRTFGR